MLSVFNKKCADYTITVKDHIPLQKKQSFSFSISFSKSIQDVMSLMELEKIIIPTDIDMPKRYRIIIIPKTNGAKTKSIFLNTRLSKVGFEKYLLSCFEQYKLQKATHFVQVINIISKELDLKSFSIQSDDSLINLREAFKKYSCGAMKDKLDDNIYFDGEKNRISHRVLVFISENSCNDNKTKRKSKSFSIRFPHYSSLEIVDNLKLIGE